MNTVNQQQTVKDVDLAWLAGFLEADGSVQMTLVNNPRGARGRTVNVWVSFDNTDPTIINRIIEILDSCGIGHYDGQKFIKPFYRQDGSFYLSEKKICLFVRVSKLKSINKILGSLLPFLCGEKKALAEIILRFTLRRMDRNTREYADEDLMIVREFIKQKDGRYATKNLDLIDRMLNDCTSDAA